MAKRIAGVTEKLMEAAKQEFLKNGYERAFLYDHLPLYGRL